MKVFFTLLLFLVSVTIACKKHANSHVTQNLLSSISIQGESIKFYLDSIKEDTNNIHFYFTDFFNVYDRFNAREKGLYVLRDQLGELESYDTIFLIVTLPRSKKEKDTVFFAKEILEKEISDRYYTDNLIIRNHFPILVDSIVTVDFGIMYGFLLKELLHPNDDGVWSVDYFPLLGAYGRECRVNVRGMNTIVFDLLYNEIDLDTNLVKRKYMLGILDSMRVDCEKIKENQLKGTM